MRVLVSSYRPPSSGSGVERFVQTFQDIARRHGHEVVVYDSSSTCLGPNLQRIRPLVAWCIGRKINRSARNEDVILCNGYFSWNARRQRSFVVYHGTEKGRALATAGELGLVRRLALNRIGVSLDARGGTRRKIVAVSKAVRNEIIGHYGHDVRSVIPNAVDTALFRPIENRKAARRAMGLPEDEFLVLYVGPPGTRKGLGWIVENIQPHLGAGERLVVRSDIGRPIPGAIVVPRQTIEGLAQLYGACDVLILPSLYEGCSFALIEALACGTPVIATATGGAMDLRDDPVLRPFIIQGRNAPQFIASIKSLSQSPTLWRTVSSKSRTYAERHHSMESFEKAYMGIIAELAGD